MKIRIESYNYAPVMEIGEYVEGTDINTNSYLPDVVASVKDEKVTAWRAMQEAWESMQDEIRATRDYVLEDSLSEEERQEVELWLEK